MEVLLPGEEKATRLPASSTDLPIENTTVLPAISIYNVLTNHHKLAGFSFEDFCCALSHKENCGTLNDIHLTLLDAILSEVNVT